MLDYDNDWVLIAQWTARRLVAFSSNASEKGTGILLLRLWKAATLVLFDFRDRLSCQTGVGQWCGNIPIFWRPLFELAGIGEVPDPHILA